MVDSIQNEGYNTMLPSLQPRSYGFTPGREFLKDAPGWVSVNLSDGGILHVSTESYRDWWENDQLEALAYFRQRFPKLQIYRAQPIPW